MYTVCTFNTCILRKVSKVAKIRNRYNQVPHLTQDTNGKVTNSQKTPQTRAKRSALSQQVTTKHIHFKKLVFLNMLPKHRWHYICIENTFLLQQQQNLGRRFGTSKMHWSLPVARAAVRSKAAVLLLLIRCLLLYVLPSWDSVFFICFVVRYFVSIIVLQSSWWGRESLLLCLVCLPGVSSLLCGSSSRCHGGLPADCDILNEVSISYRFITVYVLFLKYLKCMLAQLGYDLIKQQLYFLQ